MPGTPYSVGLVGFGAAAERFHAPLIAVEPGLQLTHVVERHRHRSQQVVPHVTVVRSLSELLETAVDLVVILTPNESHFELARQALAAGKHVVVDKPFTVSSEQADELLAAAAAGGSLLTVFHNRRWDSDFLTVREVLEQQMLGRLVEFESRYDRYRPDLKGVWREQDRPGAGVLYDLGSHLLDQALTLFGRPQWIWADLRRQRSNAAAIDAFEMVVDYPGLKVSLQASSLARLPGPRFVLRGDRGSFVKSGLDPQEEELKAGRLPQGEDWGREPRSSWGLLATSWGDLKLEARVESLPGDYPAFYRNLVDSLRKGSEPAVAPSQARDIIRSIELVQHSARGRRAVEWS